MQKRQIRGLLTVKVVYDIAQEIAVLHKRGGRTHIQGDAETPLTFSSTPPRAGEAGYETAPGNATEACPALQTSHRRRHRIDNLEKEVEKATAQGFA